MSVNKTYIPALRFRSLTRFYDLAVDFLMQGKQLRRKSAELISNEHPEAILEIASGTGELTAALVTLLPDAHILATDIDADILDLARSKLKGHRKISFKHLDAFEAIKLAPDFDVVVSSLFMHHLSTEQKESFLRVLASIRRHSSKLIIIDWGKPVGILAQLGFFLVRLLDGFEVTSANRNGMISKMITDAGFILSRNEVLHNTVLGTVWIYCADPASDEKE